MTHETFLSAISIKNGNSFRNITIKSRSLNNNTMKNRGGWGRDSQAGHENSKGWGRDVTVSTGKGAREVCW
jgi:hypothetical protein